MKRWIFIPTLFYVNTALLLHDFQFIFVSRLVVLQNARHGSKRFFLWLQFLDFIFILLLIFFILFLVNILLWFLVSFVFAPEKMCENSETVWSYYASSFTILFSLYLLCSCLPSWFLLVPVCFLLVSSWTRKYMKKYEDVLENCYCRGKYKYFIIQHTHLIELHLFQQTCNGSRA